MVIWAAEFWSSCSLWRSLRGKPERRRSQRSIQEMTRALTEMVVRCERRVETVDVEQVEIC